MIKSSRLRRNRLSQLTLLFMVRKENFSRVESATSCVNSFLVYIGGAYSSVMTSTSAALPWKKKTKFACSRHIFGTRRKCCVHMKVVQLTCRTW